VHLAAAIAELKSAEAALARCREHAAAAGAHRRECDEEVERTQAVVAEIRRQAAADLRGRLTGTTPIGTSDRKAADEATAMAAAEAPRRGQAVAAAAERDIAAAVTGAEAALRTSYAAVVTAARAVCSEAYREARERLALLEGEAEVVRRHSWELRATAERPPERWAPQFRELIVNAEAPILPEPEGAAVPG
jgi:hypothetical protein